MRISRTRAVAGCAALGAVLTLFAFADAFAHPHKPAIRSHSPYRVIAGQACPAPVVHVVTPPRPSLYLEGQRFFWNASVGLYLPGVWMDLRVGDLPRPGYVYLDPYCDCHFRSLSSYQRHLRRHAHPGAVEIVRLDRRNHSDVRHRDYRRDRDGRRDWDDDRDRDRRHYGRDRDRRDRDDDERRDRDERD